MSTAFIFPGQGSQHVGMGIDLYRHSSAARAVFDRADEVLGSGLSQLCFAGPEEALVDTVNQQPALFTVSVAAWQAMVALDWPAPAFVAGHSLGEFSALVAAGSLTVDDGLAMVAKRGQLMQVAGEQMPGGMAAILALDVAEVEGICAKARQVTGRPLQVANDNCPGQAVISGDREALAEAIRLAKEAGARKVVELPISIASHSALMSQAADEFGRIVDEAPIRSPEIPVIGNVSAQPLTTPDEIRYELRAQLTSPVAWSDSMNYLLQQGVETVVEVGPGDVLLKLMKRISRRTKRVKFEIEG